MAEVKKKADKAKDKRVNERLKPFGLTADDLSSAELAKARKDVSVSGTGGFFASEELIRKTLKKRR